MCDRPYQNKQWAEIGMNLYTVEEIEQIEWEMGEFMDWDLEVDDVELKALREKLHKESDGLTFFGDVGSYTLPLVSLRERIAGRPTRPWEL